MYLFERLISLAIYVFVLIIVCYAIAHTKKKDNHILLKIYVFILAIMGYCFVPHTGSDLYRLNYTMHYYSEKTVPDLLTVLSNSSTPGTGLYFYIIGKIGNDKFLPCISALITFSFCFALLHYQLDENNIKPAYCASALFVFMSRGLMMQIISNIRTIMALSICAWCVYQEFYKHAKWRKLIIPYVLAASLHVMGQVMLLYRIAFLLIEKERNRNRKIWRLVGAIIAVIAVCICGRNYITRFIVKASGYFKAARLGAGYSYIWEGILCIFVLLLLFYMIISYQNIKTHIQDKMSEIDVSATERLITFILPLIAIDIIAIFLEFNFFQRTNWFLSVLMIPLSIQLFRISDYAEKGRMVQNSVMAISFIILILACARGDLCSLKFFIFN